MPSHASCVLIVVSCAAIGHNITPEVRAGADFDFKSLRTQFIIIAVPRLMVIVFTHAIPYLVKDVVAFSAQGEITAQDILKYTGYTALLFGGKTVSGSMPLSSIMES